MAAAPPPPDPVFALRGHAGDVTSVAFHPTSQTILSTSADSTLKVWDIKTRRCIADKRLGAPTLWAEALHGDRILAQCRGGALSILNANASLEAVLTMQTGSIGFCKSAVSGDAVAMPSDEDGQIRLWDLRTGQSTTLLAVPDTENRTGLCMAIQMHGQRVLGFFESGWVYAWDLASPSSLHTSLKLMSEPIICAAMSRDNAAGVVGSAGSVLARFEVAEKGLLKGADLALPQAGVNDVRIRGDEKIFATAGWDHRVRVFSWRKSTPLAVLRFHTGAVNCVAFQPHSNLLAAASADARIGVWAIY